MRKLNAVVMTLAGGLLIAAAVLKVHEVLTVYFPSWREHGVWESWEFFLVQIPVEFALGVWMVSGLFRKAAWLAGTIAYFGFIGVTLYKALIGAESCGCFGRVEVDPWITLFAVDVPFALLLVIFRPKGLKLLPPPWPRIGHAIATAIPIFAALIFTAPMLVAFRPEFTKPEDWTAQGTPPPRPIVKPKPVDVSDPADVRTDPAPPADPTPIAETDPEPEPERTDDPTVHTAPSQTDAKPDQPAAAETEAQPDQTPEPEPIRDPEPEIEPEPETEPKTEPEIAAEPESEPEPEIAAPPLWPWLEYIDIADQLKEGIVVAYMYHHDCSICADSVPTYEAYHKEMEQMGVEEFTIAYLAIPPYGQGPVPADTTCLHGKLTDKRSWAITSPFVVALIDGSVVKQWPQGQAPEPDAILDEIFGP